MKSLTIVADDRVGLLSDISYVLGKSKINIESISVDVIGNKAVIVLTIKNSDKAREVLTGSGYSIEEDSVLVLKLDDKPGELNRITSLLADSGISIQNVQILSRDGSQTVIGVVVDKPKKAEKILSDFLLTRES
ncbi:MAG TPA: ACT domain-containing protein [Candidatus Bilamarchaeaceae archaeon]|nr:ACT domain-containing protein [Candidatus Bilamarchaeaceae archaeon]